MTKPLAHTITLLLLTATARAQTPPTPAASLAAHLAATKNLHSLSARFLCEKRLALLDTPLESAGQVWIRRGEKSSESAVRFSTEKPYLSELILADGKVYARSQHEDEWAKSNQSSRPGLTAVMSELGGWATGDPGKIADLYSVATSDAAIPPPPATAPAFSKPTPKDADLFLLTPTNKDLAKAVKQITLALDPATGTLLYIEILTAQDDATRYWFGDIQTNPPLPPDIFEPKSTPAPTAQTSETRP